MLYFVPFIIGIGNAVQTGANAALGRALDNKFAAALCVLAVSAGTLLVAGLATGRLGLPGADKVAATPWWAWTGGALGAAFVLSQLFVAQQVGSAVFMTLTVTASVITSLVLDHYGLMGFEQHAAGWGRIAGAAFIVAGLVLVAKS